MPTDITVTAFKPAPAAAAHYQEKDLTEKLQELLLSPLGLGLGIPAVLVLLLVAFLSFSFFITGDIASGFATLLALALLAGGVILLGRYILKHIHGDASAANAYESWQKWLELQYNIKLTDRQNDELVNAVGGNEMATMNKDYTWGKTTISRLGRKIEIRLVGDDTQGYTVQMSKGRKFVPLKQRR